MKFRARKFKLEMSIKIAEQSNWPEKEPEITFSIRENIPTGSHPVDYLRQRMSEEIRRHASQTTIRTNVPLTSAGEIAE